MSHVSLGNVLIIDDNPNEIRSLIKLLKVENYAVTALEDPKLALDSIINSNIDCVLLDYQFQDVNGIEVLQKITNTHPDLPVIMISGRGSLSIAVEAMKRGAFYYLEKPIEPQIFVHQLKNAVRQQHLRKEREELISELSKNLHMIGKSLPMQHIRNLINKFSPSSEPILILGESGTGKELVAKAIHLCSDRRLKPLVQVNCARISEQFLESELFGHVKGAFTGANKERKGKFRAANDGTLFLDEIGDMNESLQAKLLRSIEYNEIEVLGSDITEQINVRIVAATNKNLSQLVKEKRFREDLFYRLNVLKIEIPSLRERRDDVLELADFFLHNACEMNGKDTCHFSPDAVQALMEYDWPGNIRELRNLIYRVVLLGRNNVINAYDINSAIAQKEILTNRLNESLELQAFKPAVEAFEKYLIKSSLKRSKGRISKAAKLLDIDRITLYRKMKKYLL